MRHFTFKLLSLSCCLLIASGCGGSGDTPKLAKVTGTVKMDGQPVKNATIVFIPMDHEKARQSVGTTDENGVYNLQYSMSETGAMLGNHKVTISTAGSGDSVQAEDGTYGGGGGEKVPAKYNVQTELTAKVEAGSNTIDFVDLDSAGEIIEVNDAAGY